MSNDRRFINATAALFFTVVGVALLVSGPHPASAGTPNLPAVQIYNLAPVYSDPQRYTGSVGDTPTIGIANPAIVLEGAIQRLLITNKSTVNDLCVFWVATASACGTSINCDGSGTDNGDLILPRSVKEVMVAGDLRTCVVASATSTTFHISRSKVE